MIITAHNDLLIAKEHRDLVSVLYCALQREHSYNRQLRKAERKRDEKLAEVLRQFRDQNSMLIEKTRKLLAERMALDTTAAHSLEPSAGTH